MGWVGEDVGSEWNSTNSKSSSDRYYRLHGYRESSAATSLAASLSCAKQGTLCVPSLLHSSRPFTHRPPAPPPQSGWTHRCGRSTARL